MILIFVLPPEYRGHPIPLFRRISALWFGMAGGASDHDIFGARNAVTRNKNINDGADKS
jgi:hypothetical protein